ncbi:MAG: hypothetical protein ACRC1H_04695, partial [Caldilineaceae bacterium]
MARSLPRSSGRPAPNRFDFRSLLLLSALLLAMVGVYQLVAGARVAIDATPPPTPQPAMRLLPGVVASMDSPAITWSPGWTVSALGADPAEPADPASEPAGTLSFEFSGRALELLVAVGDYWGFLYATVDGKPATLLPDSRFHQPPVSPRAGYAPLLAPEAVDAAGQPTERW